MNFSEAGRNIELAVSALSCLPQAGYTPQEVAEMTRVLMMAIDLCQEVMEAELIQPRVLSGSLSRDQIRTSKV